MQIYNKTVAERIGLSESGVWMIRHGKRFPLMKTMEAIEREYDWPVTEQVAARSDYADSFNARLQTYYTKHGL